MSKLHHIMRSNLSILFNCLPFQPKTSSPSNALPPSPKPQLSEQPLQQTLTSTSTNPLKTTIHMDWLYTLIIFGIVGDIALMFWFFWNCAKEQGWIKGKERPQRVVQLDDLDVQEGGSVVWTGSGVEGSGWNEGNVRRRMGLR